MAADVWGFPKPGSYTRRTLWHSIEGPNQGEKGKLHLALLEKGKSNPIVRNATSISHHKKECNQSLAQKWERREEEGVLGGMKKSPPFFVTILFISRSARPFLRFRWQESGGEEGGGNWASLPILFFVPVKSLNS